MAKEPLLTRAKLREIKASGNQKKQRTSKDDAELAQTVLVKKRVSPVQHEKKIKQSTASNQTSLLDRIKKPLQNNAISSQKVSRSAETKQHESTNSFLNRAILVLVILFLIVIYIVWKV